MMIIAAMTISHGIPLLRFLSGACRVLRIPAAGRSYGITPAVPCMLTPGLVSSSRT